MIFGTLSNAANTAQRVATNQKNRDVRALTDPNSLENSGYDLWHIRWS